jgi:hypothetical protein
VKESFDKLKANITQKISAGIDVIAASLDDLIDGTIPQRDLLRPLRKSMT